MSRLTTDGRGFARDLPALLVALVLCFGVAGLGAYWTSLGLGAWYDSLRKPSWTPPNSAFGPVWTALYAMMAVAAWTVWKRRGAPGRRVALALFGLQLALNLAWPGLFFALGAIGPSFGEILLLWAAILATLRVFGRIDRGAGLLLVPYLLWTTYASALNGAIWRLNP